MQGQQTGHGAFSPRYTEEKRKAPGGTRLDQDHTGTHGCGTYFGLRKRGHPGSPCPPPDPRNVGTVSSSPKCDPGPSWPCLSLKGCPLSH